MSRASRRPGAVVDAAASGRDAIPVLVLVACVFLSGAGSLTLEVVWSRLLRLVFGSTTLAISTVLVAYMFGLGLGGLLGGRLATRWRRAVRAYGLMELGIGGYALIVPFVLGLYPELNRFVVGSLGFTAAAAVRFVLALAVLLIPTMLMGATLPIVVSALVRDRGKLGRYVGLLYGVNTLGAMAGVLGATFFLFPAVGLRATNLVGAVADLAVGFLAIFVLSPRLDKRPRADLEPETASSALALGGPTSELARSLALVSYGLVGFSALLFEVCWTRALTLMFGSSVYAFASMLAAFLAGIALGSLLIRRWLDRLNRPLAIYAYGLVALSLLSVGTAWLLPRLPDLFLHFIVRFGMTGTTVLYANSALSILAMLGPTLVLGALFPLLVRGISGRRSAAAAVGSVYFVNTVGSALGAFSAGFLLIPLLGLGRAMTAGSLLVLVASAISLASLPKSERRGAAIAAAVLAVTAIVVLVGPGPLDVRVLTRGVYQDPQSYLDLGVELRPLEGVESREEIVFYRDGINATVSVQKQSGTLDLRVNGRSEAGIDDIPTEFLLGHLPLLFGGEAERILVIGFGSGVTTGAIARHEGTTVDVVELEEAVLEASELFAQVNDRPLENPRVNKIVDDGRSVLTVNRNAYDVISSQPSSPWISGTSNLFTLEFFRAARQALRPGGRIIQWIGLFSLDPDALASIVAAMRVEFPHIYGFLEHSRTTDLILVGSETPLTADDLPRWERLSGPVRSDLRLVGIESTVDLWSLLAVTPTGAAQFADSAQSINSDDSMYVELNAPWTLYASPAAALRALEELPGTVLEIAETDGHALSADEVGELSFAYASGRVQPTRARRLAEEAARRGASPHADASEALLSLLSGRINASEYVQLVSDAIARAPGSAALRFSRAGQLHALGRFPEALDDLDAILSFDAEHLGARRLRARILPALGRHEEARSEFEALLATRLAQTDKTLWAGAAVTAAQSGDLATAAEEMARYLESAPQSDREWTVLAEIFRQMGRAEDEQRARNNAEIARGNRLLDAHREARLAAVSGAKTTSIQMLEQIVAGNPGYAPAQRDLERLRRGELPNW